MHGTDYVVQPLPVSNFSIAEGSKKNTFRLSWQAVDDPLEPTAKAREYIVYTRLGHGGFDNGTLVRDTKYTFEAEPGLVYSFKVTAVNRGGESFPSEILSAYKAKKSKGTVLIVNAFDRLSGPATIESNFIQGFDLKTDPGIPYISTPAYCGAQQSFDRSRIGRETKDGLGYSGSELEGMLIAGNTFDYPFIRQSHTIRRRIFLCLMQRRSSGKRICPTDRLSGHRPHYGCGETGILPYHATTYHGLLPPWWKHIGQRFLYRQQHEQSFGTRLYREHTEIQFWRKHGRKNIRHYLRCQHPFYNSLHRE